MRAPREPASDPWKHLPPPHTDSHTSRRAHPGEPIPGTPPAGAPSSSAAATAPAPAGVPHSLAGHRGSVPAGREPRPLGRARQPPEGRPEERGTPGPGHTHPTHLRRRSAGWGALLPGGRAGHMATLRALGRRRRPPAGPRGRGYGVRGPGGGRGRGSTAGPERSQHGRRGRREPEPRGRDSGCGPRSRPPGSRPPGPRARRLSVRPTSGS